MLSDEEKKAIEDLKDMIEKSKDLMEEEFYKLATIHNIQAVATVLNLIKKQSKEIEELKEENRTQKRQLNDAFDRGWVHEDKIKAKIEEINKKICEYKKWKELGTETDVDYYDYIGMEIAKTFLQSLLEKE